MINEVKNKVGDNIRSMREQNGWSQEYLGYFAQINQDTMSRLENGKSGLSLLTLIKLTTALDKPLNDLFQ